MHILAFESSCDDTSVAVLHDTDLLAMATHTQIEHQTTQGVVPEIAARLHADHVFSLLDEVFSRAGITLQDIDVIAVTQEPGLIPSLLIGKTVAKTLAHTLHKPLIGVNHIEGHIFSVLLERDLQELIFPSVELSASGGHNDLFIWHSLYHIEKIGGTRDDSAGESLDKVGRAMGLSFPAGRDKDMLASQFDPHREYVRFPRVFPADSWDFSFSGIKSAAIREIEARSSACSLTIDDKQEIAYAYQSVVTDILSERLISSAKHFNTRSICLVGGVSANSALRAKLQLFSEEAQMPLFIPKSLKYCGDNAAMIGIRAYYETQR